MDQLIRIWDLAYAYCQAIAVHVQLSCRTSAFGTVIIHFYTLKIVSMIRKYHNHKPQTTPWHRKEEPSDTNREVNAMNDSQV